MLVHKILSLFNINTKYLIIISYFVRQLDKELGVSYFVPQVDKELIIFKHVYTMECIKLKCGSNILYD